MPSASEALPGSGELVHPADIGKCNTSSGRNQDGTLQLKTAGHQFARPLS